MSLTDREDYLDLRARCIRLVAALRETRDHNPETLAAFERLLQPERIETRVPRLRFPLAQDTARSLQRVRQVA